MFQQQDDEMNIEIYTTAAVCVRATVRVPLFERLRITTPSSDLKRQKARHVLEIEIV